MEYKRFLTAAEVFQLFGVDSHALDELVESGDVQALADLGTFKYRSEDFAKLIQSGKLSARTSAEMFEIDDDGELPFLKIKKDEGPTIEDVSFIELDEDALQGAAESNAPISLENAPAPTDTWFVDDEQPISLSSATSGEIPVAPVEDGSTDSSEFELVIDDSDDSDSDVRLPDDLGMISLDDSDVIPSGSDSDVRLVGPVSAPRSASTDRPVKLGTDSDVRLSSNDSGSDSDVVMLSDAGMSTMESGDFHDSEISLVLPSAEKTDSDSDVRIAPNADSSDVIRSATVTASNQTDSDIVLIGFPGADLRQASVEPPAADRAKTDSDVTLVPNVDVPSVPAATVGSDPFASVISQAADSDLNLASDVDNVEETQIAEEHNEADSAFDFQIVDEDSSDEVVIQPEPVAAANDIHESKTEFELHLDDDHPSDDDLAVRLDDGDLAEFLSDEMNVTADVEVDDIDHGSELNLEVPAATVESDPVASVFAPESDSDLDLAGEVGNVEEELAAEELHEADSAFDFQIVDEDSSDEVAIQPEPAAAANDMLESNSEFELQLDDDHPSADDDLAVRLDDADLAEFLSDELNVTADVGGDDVHHDSELNLEVPAATVGSDPVASVFAPESDSDLDLASEVGNVDEELAAEELHEADSAFDFQIVDADSSDEVAIQPEPVAAANDIHESNTEFELHLDDDHPSVDDDMAVTLHDADLAAFLSEEMNVTVDAGGDVADHGSDLLDKTILLESSSDALEAVESGIALDASLASDDEEPDSGISLEAPAEVDSGITLETAVADIAAKEDSGISLEAVEPDSGLSLAPVQTESDIAFANLQEDSGIRLEAMDAGSGINLDALAGDSGITLEPTDSGIRLESVGDSGISIMAEDSGISLEDDDLHATFIDGDAVDLDDQNSRTASLHIPDGAGIKDSGFDLSLKESDNTIELDFDADDESGSADTIVSKDKGKKPSGKKSLNLSEAFQLDEPIEVEDLDISEDLDAAGVESEEEFVAIDDEILDVDDEHFSSGVVSIPDDVEDAEEIEEAVVAKGKAAKTVAPAKPKRPKSNEPEWGLGAVGPIIASAIALLITTTVLWGGITTMWSGAEAPGPAAMLISTLAGMSPW